MVDYMCFKSLHPVPSCDRRVKRDLLPLPVVGRPSGWRSYKEGARSTSSDAEEDAWVLLMTAVLNWQYCGDTCVTTLQRRGPPTALQQAASFRLRKLAYGFMSRERVPISIGADY